jgi:hypothetical protein
LSVHLFGYVLQLHDGNTDKAVLSCEAIVLDAYVKLVGGRLLLVSNDTGRED